MSLKKTHNGVDLGAEWPQTRLDGRGFILRLSRSTNPLFEMRESHRLPKAFPFRRPRLRAQSSQSSLDNFNFRSTNSTNCLSSSEVHTVSSSEASALASVNRRFRFGGEGAVASRARLFFGVEKGSRNSWSEFSLSTSSSFPQKATALHLLFLFTGVRIPPRAVLRRGVLGWGTSRSFIGDVGGGGVLDRSTERI